MATVFPDAGAAFIVDLLDPDDGQTKLTDIYVAWGTGGGTAAEVDTTLFTEAAEARVAVTHSQQTTTTTGDTYQGVGTITSSSAQTITNAGLFDASTSGDMLLKGDFTGIILANGDKIEFTCQLQFG
jgi:hypothetical protein